MMRIYAMTAACLGLMACQPIGKPATPMPDDCGAAALAAHIGGPVAALPPGAGPLRVIRPGMAVTMDYNAARLNARVDEAGVILSLTCG